MKRRLSILAVTLLSTAGWGAAAQPLEGTLHLDVDGGGAARRGKDVTCTHCVSGVRG